MSTNRVGQKGMAVVEMAIVLFVLLLLVFGIFDLSRVYFTHVTLQHAMREGGRFGVTGRALPDPNNPDDVQSRIESIKQIVREAAAGVDVDVEDIHITSVNGGDGSAGGPGDAFTLSLHHEVHLTTPIIADLFEDGVYAFTAQTSFRNEPFAPTGEE